MKLDDIIGDVIFISFRDNNRMKDIGIKNNSGHYLLKGYDQLGLWLEHPGILIQHLEDKNGRPLPNKEQTQEKIDAVFMVQWENINTMMHYPNRKDFDFPDQYRKSFGFRFKEQKGSAEE